ncbi:MAG: phosphoribosylglycinamide formyltransferase [bacterium]|nr:phosphoribosylglycinamide formyltransferase [bacterium]
MNIAIFASGEGRNFENIVKACRSGYIKNSKVVILIASKMDAGVVKRSTNLGIEYKVIEKNKNMDIQEFNYLIFNEIKYRKIDLICLAGFIYRITNPLLYFFNNRILNIHPALLPEFGGKGMYGDRVFKAILESKVRRSGVTVHIVNEELDKGPVIIQEEFELSENETIETLKTKTHNIENRLYPFVLRLFSKNRIYIFDKRVYILSGFR